MRRIDEIEECNVVFNKFIEREQHLESLLKDFSETMTLAEVKESIKDCKRIFKDRLNKLLSANVKLSQEIVDFVNKSELTLEVGSIWKLVEIVSYSTAGEFAHLANDEYMISIPKNLLKIDDFVW